MEAGTLLYIKNYLFEDKTSKDKFLLVIKNLNEEILIISLPSSKDYVPNDKTGCVDIPEANQIAFIFKAGEIVTNQNFSFKAKTYLYGQYVTLKSINDFKTAYPIKDVHYEYKGKLKKRILKSVIECFKQSTTVKNKIKRML